MYRLRREGPKRGNRQNASCRWWCSAHHAELTKSPAGAGSLRPPSPRRGKRTQTDHQQGPPRCSSCAPVPYGDRSHFAGRARDGDGTARNDCWALRCWLCPRAPHGAIDARRCTTLGTRDPKCAGFQAMGVKVQGKFWMTMSTSSSRSFRNGVRSHWPRWFAMSRHHRCTVSRRIRKCLTGSRVGT